MKNQNTIISHFRAALCVLLTFTLSTMLFGCGVKQTPVDETVPTESTVLEVHEETAATVPAETEPVIPMPWEEDGAKQPADYTWEEYEALTGAQQQAFRKHLGEEKYGAWLKKMRENADVKPWDEPGAKQPMEYSWAEFEALSSEDQIAFQNYLGLEGFPEWLSRVQSQMEELPWEKPGAKQPKAYTMAEFDDLTATQQMLFQYYLGTEGFAQWLESVQPKPEPSPWEKAGAKQPADYTWADFEALTPTQQMAFQEALGTAGFENWLNQIQSQDVTNPWDKAGAKQPADYTWADFEALTSTQQMAFQEALGTAGFENWLNQVQSQDAANPWEKPGAKQPEDYTWPAFEALSPEQQMAFQNYLGEEAFENWLNKAQSQTEANPWEKPGAKQPENYTWAEFEALTGPQQIAFQNALGQEAFDMWLNQATGQ